MAKRLQLRRGTTAQTNAFKGADGEVTVDTTKKTLVLHDGVTAGGKPLPTLESGKVPLSQLPEATTSTKGVVQLATNIEAVAGTNATNVITPSTMVTGIKSALNVSGNAPTYTCRAWVNFNGTGTVAIRGSGNVSSITDNGVGDYTVNFSTAMQDANYSAEITGNSVANGANMTYLTEHVSSGSLSRTSTSIRVLSTASGGSQGGATDHITVNVSIFR